MEFTRSQLQNRTLVNITMGGPADIPKVIINNDGQRILADPSSGVWETVISKKQKKARDRLCSTVVKGVKPVTVGVHDLPKPFSQSAAVSQKLLSKPVEVCRHFLNGNCRHGFRGKGNGSPCLFLHPKSCKRWLEHGRGKMGCKLGDKCIDLHPKLCAESLKQRTCVKLRDGGKCTRGYHLSGTRASVPQPSGPVLVEADFPPLVEARGPKGPRPPVEKRNDEPTGLGSGGGMQRPLYPDDTEGNMDSQSFLGDRRMLRLIMGELKPILLFMTGNLYHQNLSQNSGRGGFDLPGGQNPRLVEAPPRRVAPPQEVLQDYFCRMGF